MSNLHDLLAAGQSVWLDYIRRDLVADGDLARLIDLGVRGLTSNPTIFQKAIAGSDLYDDRIAAADALPATEVFEELAVADVRAAADVLRPVYEASNGRDGFVSLEVSPHLAHDTAGTVAEARRLWGIVDRPNLMIKVPATAEGPAAVETLVAEGINVNATLIFSVAHYEAVARAFARGAARADHPERVASVASFFVSRVDTKVDAALEDIGTAEALALRGTIAVANAKLAYRRFRQLLDEPDYRVLRDAGGQIQRVLWASTSTKNPRYRDVLYVEELVGRDTVNTVPPNTLEAFLDHGRVVPDAVVHGVGEAAERVRRLGELGIDLGRITEELQVEGVAAFAASYDDLLETLASKTAALAG